MALRTWFDQGQKGGYGAPGTDPYGNRDDVLVRFRDMFKKILTLSTVDLSPGPWAQRAQEGKYSVPSQPKAASNAPQLEPWMLEMAQAGLPTVTNVQNPGGLNNGPSWWERLGSLLWPSGGGQYQDMPGSLTPRMGQAQAGMAAPPTQTLVPEEAPEAPAPAPSTSPSSNLPIPGAGTGDEPYIITDPSGERFWWNPGKSSWERLPLPPEPSQGTTPAERLLDRLADIRYKQDHARAQTELSNATADRADARSAREIQAADDRVKEAQAGIYRVEQLRQDREDARQEKLLKSRRDELAAQRFIAPQGLDQHLWDVMSPQERLEYQQNVQSFGEKNRAIQSMRQAQGTDFMGRQQQQYFSNPDYYWYLSGARPSWVEQGPEATVPASVQALTQGQGQGQALAGQQGGRPSSLGVPSAQWWAQLLPSQQRQVMGGLNWTGQNPQDWLAQLQRLVPGRNTGQPISWAR